MITPDYGICEVCRKLFIKRSANQKYCSSSCRETYEERQIKKQRDREGKQKEKNIADITKLAKEEGLTYGQYVAKHHL